MGLAIAALVCIHETWFVLAGSKVLVPWDAGFKARALRTVIFSLATAPATTSSLEKKKIMFETLGSNGPYSLYNAQGYCC